MAERSGPGRASLDSEAETISAPIPHAQLGYRPDYVGTRSSNTLSWRRAFSAAAGLITRSPEGASGFTFFVIFLPYPSSAFVPIDTMPGWIQGIAERQPVTPVVESLQGLLTGEAAAADMARALTWSSAILVVSIVLSTLLFRRRTS